MRRGELGVRVAVALSLLAFAREAGAFCRTTTCDAIDADAAECDRDSHYCSVSGAPLFWKDRCISFSVQKDGSVTQGVDWEALDGIVSTGFAQWTRAPCGGGAPSLNLVNYDDTQGPVDCAEPEYNKKGANANVWMFRDNDWPYRGASSTLALTTVTFYKTSGTILDADVEINSFAITLSTSDEEVTTDLPSVVTHEAGHFLGLAHSDLPQATMNASYEHNSVAFRTLDIDDVNAICTVYPPDRDVPQCTDSVPRQGFTPTCGGEATVKAPLTGDDPDDVGPEPPAGCTCALPGKASRGASGAATLALGVASLAAARRRRRARR